MLKSSTTLIHIPLLILFLWSGGLFAAVHSNLNPQHIQEVDQAGQELSPKQTKPTKKNKRKIEKARKKLNSFFQNKKIRLGLIALILGIVISLVASLLIKIFGFLGFIGVFLAIIGVVMLVWGLLESLA